MWEPVESRDALIAEPDVKMAEVKRLLDERLAEDGAVAATPIDFTLYDDSWVDMPAGVRLALVAGCMGEPSRLYKTGGRE